MKTKFWREAVFDWFIFYVSNFKGGKTDGEIV
jgi:hypothetical protein